MLRIRIKNSCNTIHCLWIAVIICKIYLITLFVAHPFRLGGNSDALSFFVNVNSLPQFFILISIRLILIRHNVHLKTHTDSLCKWWKKSLLWPLVGNDPAKNCPYLKISEPVKVALENDSLFLFTLGLPTNLKRASGVNGGE